MNAWSDIVQAVLMTLSMSCSRRCLLGMGSTGSDWGFVSLDTEEIDT